MVVAFGQLIKPHVLAEVPMVNLHFSLLPRWRGAAPVERALLAGDAETGVCLMQLEEGLDTGPVYDTVRVPIGPTHHRATSCARELVAGGHRAAGPLPRRSRSASPCRSRASRCTPRRSRPTSCASTGRGPPREIDRLVRLGGAWTTFRGKRVKVLAAELDERAIADAAHVRASGWSRCSPRARGRWRSPTSRVARVPQPGETFE